MGREAGSVTPNPAGARPAPAPTSEVSTVLTFKHAIDRRGVELRFSEKPDERIRAMLKANGFRWAPSAGVWWRRRIEGTADFLDALRKALFVGPPRPDGPCWRCKAPAGFFRPRGAATPVYCDACAAIRETPAPPDPP